MLLIGAMITVYSNKLRIDNISAFDRSYIQTIDAMLKIFCQHVKEI